MYTDRHSVFWRSGRERDTLAEELAGEREPTQFGRTLAELKVEMIFASSPQACGRIERLWGTRQDRLKAELRLADIAPIAQGNAFLPAFLERHNARFALVLWRGGMATAAEGEGRCLPCSSRPAGRGCSRSAARR